MSEDVEQKMRILVEGDGSLDLSPILIEFTQGVWQMIHYPIYSDNQVQEATIPYIKEGLYTLNIWYGNEFTTNELFRYDTEPELEVLKFNFFKENNRIFCRIRSLSSLHLTKLIVLHETEEIIEKSELED